MDGFSLQQSYSRRASQKFTRASKHNMDSDYQFLFRLRILHDRGSSVEESPTNRLPRFRLPGTYPRRFGKGLKILATSRAKVSRSSGALPRTSLTDFLSSPRSWLDLRLTRSSRVPPLPSRFFSTRHRQSRSLWQPMVAILWRMVS